MWVGGAWRGSSNVCLRVWGGGYCVCVWWGGGRCHGCRLALAALPNCRAMWRRHLTRGGVSSPRLCCMAMWRTAFDPGGVSRPNCRAPDERSRAAALALLAATVEGVGGGHRHALQVCVCVCGGGGGGGGGGSVVPEPHRGSHCVCQGFGRCRAGRWAGAALHSFSSGRTAMAVSPVGDAAAA